MDQGRKAVTRLTRERTVEAGLQAILSVQVPWPAWGDSIIPRLWDLLALLMSMPARRHLLEW